MENWICRGWSGAARQSRTDLRETGHVYCRAGRNRRSDPGYSIRRAVPLRRRVGMRPVRAAPMRSNLGAKHFALAASGSNALAAALTALGLGPGDEVIIPAHTYMATATSVLAVGAIPLIVDIDESLTIDPKAIEAAIGPRTRAVIPVHMWGRGLQHAGDPRHRPGARAVRHRGRLPGGRRVLRGAAVRHDRRHRRLQLQLLQEHDLRGGRRRGGQRRRPRGPRPVRHRPLSLLLEGPRRRGQTLLGQRRPRLRTDGRHAQRPARPARRHGRRHAGREEIDPGRHPLARQPRPAARPR